MEGDKKYNKLQLAAALPRHLRKNRLTNRTDWLLGFPPGTKQEVNCNLAVDMNWISSTGRKLAILPHKFTQRLKAEKMYKVPHIPNDWNRITGTVLGFPLGTKRKVKESIPLAVSQWGKAEKTRLELDNTAAWPSLAITGRMLVEEFLLAVPPNVAKGANLRTSQS